MPNASMRLLAALALIPGSLGLSSPLVAQAPDPAAPKTPVIAEAPVDPSSPSSTPGVGPVHRIAAGDTVKDVVLIDQDLELSGTIEGGLVIVKGNVTLKPGSSVTRDVVVVLGKLIDEGGTIHGDRLVLGGEALASAEVKKAMESKRFQDFQKIQEKAAAHKEKWAKYKEHSPSPLSGRPPVLGTVVLLLSMIGLCLVLFRSRVEKGASALIEAPLRNFGIGLAASCLVLPAYLILILVLTVSLIGIPLLPLAILFYPFAMLGTAAFGLTVSVLALGQWSESQGHIRWGNCTISSERRVVLAGLLALLGLLLLAGLIGTLLPGGGLLLRVFAYLWIWIAAVAGFGAALTTRLGKSLADSSTHVPVEGTNLPAEEETEKATS